MIEEDLPKRIVVSGPQESKRRNKCTGRNACHDIVYGALVHFAQARERARAKGPVFTATREGEHARRVRQSRSMEMLQPSRTGRIGVQSKARERIVGRVLER